MDTLIQYIKTILSWLLQFVDWVITEVFQVVMGALLSILNAIPMPAWLANAGNAMSQLPPGVMYFSQALDFSTGLTIVLSAYGIRFLIRRIPIIG